ncbi:MAG: hypothetical protein JWM11_5154, partial [Planctomycetaceae bacterium]|nr:hypothetical protein [Planctomycetaceae bacterium]
MLPTCPACKQSVLDDDAVECPFCGANMKTGKGAKAKPAAGSAPAKTVPRAEPAAASKPAASTSKPSSPKPSKARSASTFDDDENDPFAVSEDDPFTAAAKEEAANKANAIPVSPRKGKL